MTDASELKPFGQRVTVTDPPKDPGTKRIFLPDGVRADLTPGIVMEVGDDIPNLEPGDLIYFSHVCNQIGDTYIIEGGCIIAYEKLARGEDRSLA